jgi:hypothetical protein
MSSYEASSSCQSGANFANSSFEAVEADYFLPKFKVSSEYDIKEMIIQSRPERLELYDIWKAGKIGSGIKRKYLQAGRRNMTNCRNYFLQKFALGDENSEKESLSYLITASSEIQKIEKTDFYVRKHFLSSCFHYWRYTPKAGFETEPGVFLRFDEVITWILTDAMSPENMPYLQSIIHPHIFETLLFYLKPEEHPVETPRIILGADDICADLIDTDFQCASMVGVFSNLFQRFKDKCCDFTRSDYMPEKCRMYLLKKIFPKDVFDFVVENVFLPRNIIDACVRYHSELSMRKYQDCLEFVDFFGEMSLELISALENLPILKEHLKTIDPKKHQVDFDETVAEIKKQKAAIIALKQKIISEGKDIELLREYLADIMDSITKMYLASELSAKMDKIISLAGLEKVIQEFDMDSAFFRAGF